MIANDHPQKSGWRYADDLDQLVVHNKSDRRGKVAPAQFALPIRVANNRPGRGTSAFVFRHQQSSTEGPDSQYLEEIAGDPKPFEVPHLTSPAYIPLVHAPSKYAREGLLLVSDLLPQRSRQLSILLIDAHALMSGVCDANFGEFLRILHGQAAQSDRIEQHKNGGVCADSERQSNNRGCREGSTLAECPQGVANVCKETFDGRPAPDFTTVLLNKSHISKFAASDGRRLFS